MYGWLETIPMFSIESCQQSERIVEASESCYDEKSREAGDRVIGLE